MASSFARHGWRVTVVTSARRRQREHGLTPLLSLVDKQVKVVQLPLPRRPDTDIRTYSRFRAQRSMD
jgi:hypothetical protein